MFAFREIFLSHAADYDELAVFLTKMNLTYNKYGVDYCIGAYHSDTDELLGTASLSGHVIHNVAVNPAYQKQGLTTALLSAIMSYGASKHIFYFQLFTKPQNISLFCNAGFRLVEQVSPYVALLEFGQQTPESWCRRVIRENNLSSTDSYAAIVMNCNPYTLGHKYLIERATENEQNVLIFVVEENRSMLPFADRYRLMQEDLQNRPQIKLCPSGPYIISQGTFPSYFLKSSDKLLAQTLLDASLFAHKIAPLLHISARYIGTEPQDIVTKTYNQTLQHILEKSHIEVKEIPRVEYNGAPISASAVRMHWKNQNWAILEKLVPASTLSYLQKNTYAAVLAKYEERTHWHDNANSSFGI